MRQLLPTIGFAIFSLFASTALAWSPVDLFEPAIERQRQCLFTVSDACPEGATCNEYGEIICRPGEVCEEEEPDCE